LIRGLKVFKCMFKVHYWFELGNLLFTKNFKQVDQVGFIWGKVSHDSSKSWLSFHPDGVCAVRFSTSNKFLNHSDKLLDLSKQYLLLITLWLCKMRLFIVLQDHALNTLDKLKAEVCILVIDTYCVNHWEYLLDVSSGYDILPEQELYLVLNRVDLLFVCQVGIVCISKWFKKGVQHQQFLNDLLKVNIYEVNFLHLFETFK